MIFIIIGSSLGFLAYLILARLVIGHWTWYEFRLSQQENRYYIESMQTKYYKDLSKPRETQWMFSTLIFFIATLIFPLVLIYLILAFLFSLLPKVGAERKALREKEEKEKNKKLEELDKVLSDN